MHRTPWLIVGGLATAAAFPLGPLPTRPPVAAWPLAWVGLTPLLVALLRAESGRAAARAALIFGCAWFFVDCVWVFRVFDVLGWALVWIPVGWLVVFGLLAFRTRDLPWLVWPLLWIGVEFVRSEWTLLRLDLFSPHLDPLRFSWLVLGHSRVSEPILAQTADIWGGYGLSLAPFLTNLALARWWVTRRYPRGTRRSWIGPAIVIALLVTAEVGYGVWQLGREPGGVAVPVGVVQTERERLDVLIDLTEQLLREAPQTRVVVWPEEAFAERPDDLDALRSLARRHDIWLATGSEHPAGEHHENIAYWVSPAGEVGVYHKRERVPFVELHTPATDAPTFPLTIDGRDLRVGVAICYDMDFPTTARELTRGGANLLAVPTLDEGGWGATQHAQHALLPRLRAIENRRPVVQAATSGVSQVIDDRGRVLAEVPYRLHRRPRRPTLYLEGVAHATVHAVDAVSVYTRGGYLFGPIVAIAGAGFVAWSLARRHFVPSPLAGEGTRLINATAHPGLGWAVHGASGCAASMPRPPGFQFISWNRHSGTYGGSSAVSYDSSPIICRSRFSACRRTVM
jgi:apolipoprotein N-acyltransferase